VELLARLLGIAVCSNDSLVLENVATLAGLVDLHQILIYHASGTDVEMSHLGVAHLPVGQSDILAAGVQLCVCACRVEIIEVRRRRVEDYVTLTMLAISPSVEDHQ